jgi:hypothetical protein
MHEGEIEAAHTGLYFGRKQLDSREEEVKQKSVIAD